MRKTKTFLALVSILVLTVLMSSCNIVDVSYVAKVNDEDVSTFLFNFYLNQVKAQLQTDDSEDYWETAEIDGQPAIEVAKERALEEAVKMTLISQMAKEEGVELTNDDIKNIGQQKNSAISQSGGQAAYEQELENMGINEETYEKILEIYALRNSLLDKVATVDEAGAKEYYTKDIARVKHVLIMNVDPNTGAPLAEDAVAEAKAKAEDILAKAKAGEDFDSLVAQYSEDPGSQSSPEGYYLGKGFALGSSYGMVTEFETASLALGVNEVSDIVETSYGYHIIKRYENDEAKFTDNIDEITYYAQSAAFETILEDKYASAKIEINEKEYKDIK